MDSRIDEIDETIQDYETQAAELCEHMEQDQKELERIEQRLVHLRETRLMLTERRQAQELGSQLSMKEKVMDILTGNDRVMTAGEIYRECQPGAGRSRRIA
jgi:uncharacterized coiled-coil DUF342 family protein